jgi:hypothetical protein
MRRGSWPLLLAAVAAFAAAFVALRGRSTFLAIAGQRDAAQALAVRHGLAVADALALRDLVGKDPAPGAWEAAAAVFVAERLALGDALAAVAAAGAGPAAFAARQAAADAETAWRRFRSDPRALPGLRFLLLRERFAALAD